MKYVKKYWIYIAVVIILLAAIIIYIIKKKSMKKMPSEWSLSPEGKKHFIESEAIRYKAYKDSAGLWTIGIGHLIKSSESYLINATLTESQVWDMFYKDAASAIAEVNKKIKVPVTQGMYDALLSLAFNTGTIYNKIADPINKGSSYDLIAQVWAKTAITVNNGKTIVKGLINRRASEIALFA